MRLEREKSHTLSTNLINSRNDIEYERNGCTLIRRRFLLPKLVSDSVSEPSVENVELKMLEFELSLSRRPVLATIRIAFDVNAATFAFYTK